MKIVYFGTPDFASYILEYLVAKGNDIVGVVTAPDKPAGRGHKLRPSAVKEVALRVLPEVPLLQPESLKDEAFLAQLEALQADLFIVIAFRMLPKEVWGMPKQGTFNLHASLLPQYRGAAPIQHAILNDDAKTGVTTFLLNEGIDQGKILMQEEIEIATDETGGSLHDKLMQLGAEVSYKTVRGLAEGTITPRPQASDEGIKYATKIFKEDRLLSFQHSSARQLELRVRALSPYPTAIAVMGDEEIKVFSAREVPSLGAKSPGTSVVTDSTLMVQCQEGALELLEVQFPNKRRTTVRDYLLGNKIEDGVIFK
ncbi:methionyl-tRNA formyltransferase [Porphyromonas levii]|uniref:methionyl-tRNA formyltransferase n=1 Tax=Porphyromonas levii TaxID=28114 RepID=UPI0020111478|nr:methionyl-tRNA formyltransferase [Porphyromonas levii]